MSARQGMIYAAMYQHAKIRLEVIRAYARMGRGTIGRKVMLQFALEIC